MGDWYLDNPDLLKKEIKELKNNGISVEVNTDASSGVTMECTIPIKNTLGIEIEEDLGLSIKFPSNYPFFRPEVSITSTFTLPRHQNPFGKNLCLIPRPTQYWNVEDSVFSFLKERLPIVLSKGKIVDQEEIGNDPEEQAEPVSEYYLSKTNIAVLSTRPKLKQKEIPANNSEFSFLNHGYINIKYSKDNSKVKLYYVFQVKDKYYPIPKLDDNSDLLKIVISEWIDSDDESIAKFPHSGFLRNGKICKTKWYQINSLPNLLNKENKYNWLINEITKNKLQLPKKLNIHTQDFIINNIVGLVFPEETIAGTIDWGWVLLINGFITKSMGKMLTPKLPNTLVLPIMSVEQEELKARIPKSASLVGKTISVIGLGSLGAPSILEFAKNGVSKLKIMDFDFVDTTTSVRWPLGLDYAGSLKTSALKRFLNNNYPDVEVEIFNHKIGSTDFVSFPNENEVLDTFLDNTSLVYDASAEEGVSNLISTLCKYKKIPFIAIEGRRGAWGGIVMRVMPIANKGCWMCLQYSLYKDKKIALPKEDEKGGIQQRGCGDLTFTGSSFDLQNISLAGVRMAVSSLSEDFGKDSWDIAVLSMVDDNENPIPPSWKHMSLEINSNCPICNA